MYTGSRHYSTLGYLTPVEGYLTPVEYEQLLLKADYLWCLLIRAKSMVNVRLPVFVSSVRSVVHGELCETISQAVNCRICGKCGN